MKSNYFNPELFKLRVRSLPDRGQSADEMALTIMVRDRRSKADRAELEQIFARITELQAEATLEPLYRAVCVLLGDKQPALTDQIMASVTADVVLSLQGKDFTKADPPFNAIDWLYRIASDATKP